MNIVKEPLIYAKPYTNYFATTVQFELRCYSLMSENFLTFHFIKKAL